jgi:hypothetical protein
MVKQHYYQTPGHVIAAGIILSLVDILAVSFRFKVRRGSKQGLKLDDWLLLPATVFLRCPIAIVGEQESKIMHASF